jgi:nicotinate phosphoribosyltransferase
MMPSDTLLTDLYQLTMLQGYFDRGMEEEAVFELFVRKLPPEWNFLLAAGLEQALDFLEGMRFTDSDLEWLRECGKFSPRFVDSLAKLHFTGAVDAIAEGTPFFPDEPLIRVAAPLPQAQLVESRLINLLHFQTLIASKAARVVLAAPGKLLVDFGLRRAHGAEAGLLAARASYLAGFDGTATVLAAPRFGIPVFGTMAHSFIQAHDDETAAFEAFAFAQPTNVVLLIDTYDTEAGADKVVKLAPRLQAHGIVVKGVRIDSGDLADHARRVRKILDRGGLPQVTIFASGNLDEGDLRRFTSAAVPIDGFGIGTRLTTSASAPYLDCAYKLQEYAGRARRKRSEGKATWPGRKQVYRTFANDGHMAGDSLTRADESGDGEPLLRPVMRGGRRLHPPLRVTELRRRAAEQIAALPEPLQRLEPAPPYRVEISPSLHALAAEVDQATAVAATARL